MKHQKSPWILVIILVAGAVGVASSRSFGGKVGSAEELQAAYQEEQEAKVKANAMANASGEKRSSNASNLSEDIKKQANEVKLMKMGGGIKAKTAGQSIIFSQKPVVVKQAPVNTASIASQWYRDEAYKRGGD